MRTHVSSPRGGAMLRAAAGLPACLALACARPAPAPSIDAGPPEPLAAPAAPTPSPEAIRVERDGLAITFDLVPRAGGKVTAHEDVDAIFTVTSAETGAPVRGLKPLAWMSRRVEGDEGASSADKAPADKACRERIKSYLAGLLSVQPDVDMNAYLVWALNKDGTISVINPQIAFRRTKLLHLISLPGAPAGHAVRPDRGAVYVAIPSASLVAVVDTRSNLAMARVSVGAAPGQVVMAPDGQRVWVGNDGDGTVSVIDAKENRVIATLDVGKGRHAIAFAEGGRTAWITGAEARAVTVVDAARLEVLDRVEVGEGAAGIAASDAASSVYVVNSETGALSIIDAGRRAVVGRPSLDRGVASVWFDPKGRFAFAPNPATNKVVILDASTGSVAHTLTGFASPDSVTFTDAFAYVHNRGATRLSLVDLGALARPDSPAVVDVALGQGPPGAAAYPGASPIAKTPEGNSVIAASGPDKALYFYVEGMMAPVGTHMNYGHEPSSVLILDRTLRETAPGVYATTVRLKDQGRYDVSLLLDSPRVATCLERDVAEAAHDAEGSAPSRPSFAPLFDPSAHLRAGEPRALRFRLEAPALQRPLDAQEITVMVMQLPGNFQQRLSPTSAGDGAYEVTFTPPEPGQYRFVPAAPTRGAPLGALPTVALGVEEGGRR